MDFCELTKDFWKVYLSSSEVEIESVANAWMSPQCVIIGTGAQEFHLNREEFIHTIMGEVQERENMVFQYDDIWCEQIQLGEDSCLVYGKIYIWWESEDKAININMDSRFTFMYHKFDGEWKIVHIHQSLPNQDQGEDEYYPKTLIEKVQEYKEIAKVNAEIAGTDALTGLKNFRAFCNQWKTRDKSGYLFMMDIDKFKDVNDNYGHVMGNEVLISMSKIISAAVREDDLVCRMGGDEFIVYCNAMENKTEAIDFAKRLIQSIHEGGINKECWATVSIGGAYAPLQEKMEIILENADRELYAVKKRQRGDCSVS